MLEAGARVPAATVATSPSETTTIAKLAASQPIVLVFYLFDWSST
jgi:peroxiredoxin